MKYTLYLDKRAERELFTLPKQTIEQIDKAIRELANSPRPAGVKKLKGRQRDGWRIRVGNYRILYHIYDDTHEIIIYKIGHRKNIYD